MSSDIPKMEAEPAPSITPVISITYHSGNLYRRTVRPTESMVVQDEVYAGDKIPKKAHRRHTSKSSPR